MKAHPYRDLPKESFWSHAVAGSSTLVPENLYDRKWPITTAQKIATAGSCFAQHIGRNMKKQHFQVLDMEPAPLHLSAEQQSKYGYSIYSARYGNIYTVRQLLQLAREAFGEWKPGEVVWKNDDGACFDALRPGVEPDGLGSPEEVMAHREYHLSRVREMLETMDLFIFTLGLTEAWIHKESGTVYPTAPGTIAGHHDPAKYEFKNFGFQEILNDFHAFRTLLRGIRKTTEDPKILLTVSPVPLTATASGKHVMLATVHSKSVLRAVAGQAANENEDVDYFPSYEIISNPWSPVSFYEPNLRSVKAAGVDEVMQTFFNAHPPSGSRPAAAAPSRPQDPITEVAADTPSEEADDVVCEEALLDAFRTSG